MPFAHHTSQRLHALGQRVARNIAAILVHKPVRNTLQQPAPNVRVLTGDEDRSGYESLPLCRLEKSERAEATPKLATGFIPPVLACDAWPALQSDILQQVFFLQPVVVGIGLLELRLAWTWR